MPAENQRTARITSPCSQFFGRPPVSMNCQIVTTASPVAAMTRTPGHHAQKPAKKPQNGPSAFCVQTYSDPSCGNISPSCAVTSAPGIRKARKPRIQYVYADGPARWIAEALTMNRTIATKMIVMSIELSTRGSIPGAIRSEIISRSPGRAAIHHLPVVAGAKIPPEQQLCLDQAQQGQTPGHGQGSDPKTGSQRRLRSPRRQGPLRASQAAWPA